MQQIMQQKNQKENNNTFLIYNPAVYTAGFFYSSNTIFKIALLPGIPSWAANFYHTITGNIFLSLYRKLPSLLLNYITASSNSTPINPIIEMVVSITVQDKKVCFKESLKNSLNIQNPESLI